jgi:outer membrane protein assembly factor BamE (lipoprotein component of BamABCDE complex)
MARHLAGRNSGPERAPARIGRLAPLVGLLGTLAGGCATVGHSFPPGKVEEIEIGRTSKSQLLGLFGLPYRRGVEDGDSTWTYVHYKFRLFGEHMRTRDLYVRFDPSGRVKSFSYNSNMEE